VNSILKLFPILETLRSYNAKWIRHDITAGLTVGIILIPQGMAYAMIAGLPPQYGLYSAVIPILVYTLFSNSRQLSIGPVAMDSLIVATTVSVLAEEGTDAYLQIALLLTLLVGIFQLLMGVLRLGFIVNFLSRPVIVGFTSAAAIIIGINQVKYLLDIDIPGNSQIHLVIGDLFSKADGINPFTLIFGLVALGILILLKFIDKRIPSALLVVVGGALCVFVLHLNDYGMDIVGEIPSGFPEFAVPSWDWDLLAKLVPPSLALAVIGFMEAVSVSKGMEESIPDYKLRSNQELVALGAANVVGSFFSSFVVTAGFSRTAVSHDAEAKTGVARLISAVVVLTAILLLTGLFYYLPEVLLAAIIIAAVIKLVDFKSPVLWWKSEKIEFLMFVATFICTAFVGIQEGIVTGILISLLILVYRATVPHMAVIARVPGEKEIYRNVKRFDDLQIDQEILIVRFDESIFYANIDYLQTKILEFEKERGGVVKTIVLDGSGINSVDMTGVIELRKMIVAYSRRGIKILFAGIKGPVRDTFKRHKLVSLSGEDIFFVDVENAVKFSKGLIPGANRKIAGQSNASD